jgi:hypothetical protein
MRLSVGVVQGDDGAGVEPSRVQPEKGRTMRVGCNYGRVIVGVRLALQFLMKLVLKHLHHSPW